MCFNCDERITAGHRCRESQLLLLKGRGEEDEDADGPELEISLHALTGWTPACTMRVAATIGHQEVVALIDSSSTHNFICEKVASRLRLPIVPTAPFSMNVANGNTLKYQGRFDNVALQIQGTPFSLTLFSLPLTGLDVVLGVQLLENLSIVTCDWKRFTMAFQWNRQKQLL